MRLFIASPVEMYDYRGVKNIFGDFIEGKWVEEANLHLTWSFLGEIDDPEPIMKRLESISPLKQVIEIGGFGFFGRPARVFYAKAKSKILTDKAKEFKEAHFNLSRFKPHITLCRIKNIADRTAIIQKAEKFDTAVLGLIKPEIYLYSSQLTEKGPKYSKLYLIS